MQILQRNQDLFLFCQKILRNFFIYFVYGGNPTPDSIPGITPDNAQASHIG